MAAMVWAAAEVVAADRFHDGFRPFKRAATLAFTEKL